MMFTMREYYLLFIHRIILNICLSPTRNDVCADSSSFCGVRNKRYPDRRSMGFPFDRRSDATSLQNFVSRSPNMRLGEVTIRFSNRYVARTQ